MLESVREILAAEGFAVTLGASARRRARHSPERRRLLFLESMLRDASAVELCRGFKSDPHQTYPSSAGRADSDAARIAALEGGSDALLSAPLQRETLVPRVQALIRETAARRLEARRCSGDRRSPCCARTLSVTYSPKPVERTFPGGAAARHHAD